MNSYFSFSNGVFIDRVICENLPTSYIEHLVHSRGYRKDDVETYRFNNDEVEKMIAQQSQSVALKYSEGKIELIEQKPIQIDTFYFKENPNPRLPDVKMVMSTHSTVFEVIATIEGKRVRKV